MSYIDAHTHLYSEEFNQDRLDVIDKAKQNLRDRYSKWGNSYEDKIAGALLCAENVDNFATILELTKEHPDFFWPCFGIHPVQGDPETKLPRSVNTQDLPPVVKWIEEHHKKLVAIGECGLDFTPRWCKTEADKEGQREVLAAQVELSKKFDLPLNVHSRSAGRPTIALLKEKGAERVLLHAFDGKASVALEGVKCGYYFSIPPSIVRSEQKSKLVQQVPLENLILETDSPALGPIKDERNVPSNVRISCEYIAKTKGIAMETVAQVTFENTLKLFPRIRNYLPK